MVRQHDQTHAEHPADVRETRKNTSSLFLLTNSYEEDPTLKSQILDISSEAQSWAHLFIGLCLNHAMNS